MPNASINVGDGSESCTQGICAYGCLHPNGSGRKVILIDTPGFGDTERTDHDTLQNIAQWLKTT
jgi:hypothetical protein